jgi:glycosyltransferase involved in cell wall biosynthesis
VDISTQKPDENFNRTLQICLDKAPSSHSRKTPIFKLWHLNGGFESFSDKQVLMTFYELDSPTKEEINIINNNHKVLVTSEYCKRVFEDVGLTNVEYVPLAFDSYNFGVKERKRFSDDRIVFNLVGKFEKRKNHVPVIQSWLKKYGNNPKYYLQCAIYNPFLNPEQNQSVIAQLLGGKRYGNIEFLSSMQSNELYNEYLNSGHIILAMSGGEGFGLPEFHSLALGKHAVVLNAHAYKSWANSSNAVMIQPSGKTPVYDNVFFQQGSPFNQGSTFIFNEDAFIAGCEAAVERFRLHPVNTEGLKLQEEFTYSKTVDKILKAFN